MVTTRKRNFNSVNIFKRSAAEPRSSFGRETYVAGMAGIVLGGVAWAGLGLL